MCIKCECEILVSVSLAPYLCPFINIHLFHSNVKVSQAFCDNANRTEAWPAKLIQWDDDFKRSSFFALFLQRTFMLKT